jgi:hypothetical protein
MKRIGKFPYTDFEFTFVMNYYDHPLTGLCRYNDELCYFSYVEMQPPSGLSEEELEDYFDNALDSDEYVIYQLSFFEKMKYLKKKKLFEICIGYHSSYSKGKKETFFHIRKPEWLYSFLFNLYFKRWSKLFTKYPK